MSIRIQKIQVGSTNVFTLIKLSLDFLIRTVTFHYCYVYTFLYLNNIAKWYLDFHYNSRLIMTDDMRDFKNHLTSFIL